MSGTTSPSSATSTSASFYSARAAFINDDYAARKMALMKRNDEMLQVATDLVERRSEHAEYAVEKYIQASNELHGFSQWDEVFDSDYYYDDADVMMNE